MRKAWLLLSFCFLFTGCDSRPKAPDFTLPSLQDQSQEVTLSALSNQQPVLLVFWATWCPSCLSEIPTLNEWQERYSPLGLKILAVNVQEPREQALDFIKENPLKYLSLADESGEVASRYRLPGLPSSVFLAKGGRILYYGFGLPENLEQLIVQK